MNVPRHAGIGLVVALLVGFWFFRDGSPRAAKPTSGTAIVAFGDSLVEGRGASPGHDFVALLSKRLSVPIVNAGRGGDTTAAALSRLDAAVLSGNPRVVIVLLGGNDFLGRVPTADTFRSLSTIVERLRQRGAAVVLVGVRVALINDPYAGEYEALARRTSSGLVPDILDDIIGHPDRMSDSIHPNDRGYEMMADRIEPVVRDLIQSD
jgi:lysophospholipase L1-like esterase